MRNNVSNLIVAFLNVRSLRHKISEVCNFIDDNSVDVIGLAHNSQATLCQSLSTAVTALAQWLEDRGLLVND